MYEIEGADGVYCRKCAREIKEKGLKLLEDQYKINKINSGSIYGSMVYADTDSIKVEGKNMNNSNNSKGGTTFLGLLQLCFIVLKLLHLINWSWFWVLSPIWIEILVIVLVVIWLRRS